jgi:hypothetical protein
MHTGQHKHVFVLTAPYSGSTLLVALLGTSPKVSILQTPQHEGLKLPALRAMFKTPTNRMRRYFPWGYLQGVYRRHWDMSKPVLVEKGQYLKDGPKIERVFPGAGFIVMTRDPYAWCESMRRRRNPQKEPIPMRELALRWVRDGAWHIHNVRTLGRVVYFTYEDLCDRTGEVLEKLKAFMPELEGMDPAGSFKVHSTLGNTHNPITNTNGISIARLSAGDVAEISAVLKDYPDILEFFGYQLR